MTLLPLYLRLHLISVHHEFLDLPVDLVHRAGELPIALPLYLRFHPLV